MPYQVERAEQLERTWLLLSQVHIESGKDDLLLVSTSRRLVDMLLDVDSLAVAPCFFLHIDLDDRLRCGNALNKV